MDNDRQFGEWMPQEYPPPPQLSMPIINVNVIRKCNIRWFKLCNTEAVHTVLQYIHVNVDTSEKQTNAPVNSSEVK